jgi:hypothetical protein
MFTVTFYIIGVLFVTACAFFSYRSGHADGLMQGMDSTLVMLEEGGIIKLQKDDNGDLQILAVENE